jgi:hypothetical protein
MYRAIKPGYESLIHATEWFMQNQKLCMPK